MEKFKELLKQMLPDGESAHVQGSIRQTAWMYITVHNGKGALSKRQRFMNKVTFVKAGDRLSTVKVVARTDENYQDKSYIELLKDIVSLAYTKATA